MTDQTAEKFVRERLKMQIKSSAGQAVRFDEYMDICLYSEPGGYYRSDKPKIGREGDFYTSSSIGTVMGEMVAAYIAREWRDKYEAEEGPFAIVEWGGGSGRLALHVLDELQSICPELYEKLSYVMVESSPYHRRLQAETTARHARLVRWRTETELEGEGTMRRAFVLANELLDAFAVRRFRLRKERVEENWVSFDESIGEFQEKWLSVPQCELPDEVADIAASGLQEGQIFEWNPGAGPWIHSIGTAMERGQLIAIDYGDVAAELFAEHRMNGTLMCYSKHRAHDNPYVLAGEQDITAHVNFTACLQAARQAGFGQAKLMTQREFLVEQGLLHKLQALPFGTDPFSPEAKRNRAIRGLLISDGMSELFKVMIAAK